MANIYDESIDMMSGDESERSSNSDNSKSDEHNFRPVSTKPHQNQEIRPQTAPHFQKFKNGTGGRPPSAVKQAQSPRYSVEPPDLCDQNGPHFLQTENVNKMSHARKRMQDIKSGVLDSDDSDSLDDDTNLSSFIDDDEDLFTEIYPTHDYGSWIDSAVEDVPSPYQAFPIPPLHDENAMMDYLRLKDIWELQLDIKRDRLREFVVKNCMNPGVHRSASICYNPDDYSHLKVTREVSHLFNYINPPIRAIITDAKLSPFVPDFYPSVGDVDAFIKVEEPFLDEIGIGLMSLDEPSSVQSDPSVLDLQLRALAKMRSAKAVIVKSLENASEAPQLIEKWTKNITELHRSKPSPSVHYLKPMPDIDLLLQEWSPEMEEVMKSCKLPKPDINCDLDTYVEIVCNLLDIPVHKSKIQSLHVLFSLYASYQELNGLMGMDPLNLGHDSRQKDDDEVDTLKIS